MDDVFWKVIPEDLGEIDEDSNGHLCCVAGPAKTVHQRQVQFPLEYQTSVRELYHDVPDNAKYI